MNHHFARLLLASFALLVAGCRGPQLVSRPLTEVEVGWASAIQRSYPGWQPPFFMPDRAHWQPRPISDADLLPMLEGEATPAVVPSPTILPSPAALEVTSPAAVAPTVAEPGETVVEVTVPAAAGKAADAAKMVPPATSSEPKVAPAKVVPEPSIDNVEFVPADTAK